ncbi:MAG: outer membrane lipoprotein chaperone LolA [Pseudomonadales bacterium]
MRHRSKINDSLLSFVLLATLLSIPVAASDDGTGSPGERLNTLLSSIKTIRASLSQITHDSGNRSLQENQGRLWFEGPAKFLIETDPPFAQLLVSDGNSFWSYDEDLLQVVIRNLEHDIKQVPILLLGGDAGKLTDDFDVSYFQDERVEYYLLVPKGTDSLFESLSIEFLEQAPLAITIVDGLGQRTRIELDEVTVNETIESSRFQFEPPPGVDVIDDRAPVHN